MGKYNRNFSGARLIQLDIWERHISPSMQGEKGNIKDIKSPIPPPINPPLSQLANFFQHILPLLYSLNNLYVININEPAINIILVKNRLIIICKEPIAKGIIRFNRDWLTCCISPIVFLSIIFISS